MLFCSILFCYHYPTIIIVHGRKEVILLYNNNILYPDTIYHILKADQFQLYVYITFCMMHTWTGLHFLVGN